MKNKKGFAFVETIVTLTILLVALTVLYTLFINLLDRQQTNAENDHPSDKYAMYYVKQIWAKNYLNNYSTSCNAYGPVYTNNNKLNLYEIKTLVVLQCDNGKVKSNNCINGKISKDFKNYIDSIKLCSTNANYILFGEFKMKENVTTYAHVNYPKVDEDDL